MNENTAKIIETLAAKLGTTSEYLWGILLRQAPVDATIGLLYIALSLTAAYLLWRAHVKMNKPQEDSSYSEYDTNDFIVILMTIMATLVGIALIASIAYLPMILSGFFNPEYWALNKILEAI